MISPEELESIKKNCLLWANNCGGCEHCTQFFGTKEPLYDHQETYMLICMIEDRDKRIKELERGLLEKIRCAIGKFLVRLNEHYRKVK